MSISFHDYPYALDALSPFMSPETIQFHYGKHHRGYVTTLNTLIQDHPTLSNACLETIMASKDATPAMYNAAAQTWNHNFFWQSLSPKSSQSPKPKLASLIQKQFESFDQFKAKFTQESKSLFGSGWVFLTFNQASGALVIHPESNAGNPLSRGLKPLLVLDVWEHAYYIDYRNDRAKYIENFWNFVNWEFAEANLSAS